MERVRFGSEQPNATPGDDTMLVVFSLGGFRRLHSDCAFIPRMSNMKGNSS